MAWKDYDKSVGRIGTNQEYWKQKIARNIERDKKVTEQLEKDGWIVLRFWEKEITKDIDGCIQHIINVIESV